MKGLSKPLSSPSRAEKFPPPLMRFLRSNVGSRSRGRSRSSPMFYLRGRRSAPMTTQEPSSPKVTCIGQVRVRRSKARTTRKASTKRRRWWRLRKSSLGFGKASSAKFNPFGKCASFFGWGYSKKVDSTDSFRAFSDGKIENLNASNKGHCSSNESEPNCTTGSLENKRGFLEPSSSSSPPKNALMLTRCRSAPYRSSSLGGRFWGSPIADKDDDGKSNNLPASPIAEEVVVLKEEEEEEEMSCNHSAENVEEIKKNGVGGGGGAVHPLLLTRCKSEPARTGERLVAEATLLRQTRLADDDLDVQQNS